MAVNIITSGFLLLVLAAGVQSAIKDLGAVCTDGTDTCVTPGLDLVCDTPKANAAGHCRVKATKACNAAGGLCVLGATCDNDACVCKGSYVAASSGKCTPVATGYGASCTSGSESSNCGLAGTANLNTAACGADNECQCSGATYGPAFDGKCAAIAAANKVGTDCATADPTKCTPNGGTATHLICDATNKCACDAGYFAKSVGGDCGAGNGTIGKACSAASDCTGTNEECSTTCRCKANYIGFAGGICFPVKGSLKGGCSTDSECTVTSGATKCTSYKSAPNTCKTALAATTACTANPTTEACGNGLVCDTTCKTALAVGAACTANPTTAACGDGLVCDTTCKTVLPKDGDCSAANTKCDTGLTCVATKCIQSNANTVTITAFLVMAVAAVGKLMM